MNKGRIIVAVTLAAGLTLLVVLLLQVQDSTALAQESRALSASQPAPGFEETASVEVSFAQAATSSLVIERVDAPKLFKNMTDRSLAVDSDGNPHVAYGQDHLYYAVWTGSAWDIQTVDPAWGVGAYAAIRIDAGGHAHISYYDETNGALKYARWTGSAWDIQTVDDSGDVGKYTSLALAPTTPYTPHIAYLDSNQTALKHAWFAGSTWISETVDNSGDVGYYNSLALAPTAPYAARISYSDYTSFEYS